MDTFTENKVVSKMVANKYIVSVFFFDCLFFSRFLCGFFPLTRTAGLPLFLTFLHHLSNLWFFFERCSLTCLTSMVCTCAYKLKKRALARIKIVCTHRCSYKTTSFE